MTKTYNDDWDFRLGSNLHELKLGPFNFCPQLTYQYQLFSQPYIIFLLYLASRLLRILCIRLLLIQIGHICTSQVNHLSTITHGGVEDNAELKGSVEADVISVSYCTLGTW